MSDEDIHSKLLVVGSLNSSVGIHEAMRILREGGSAVDAVESAIRLVELNPDDHTVGLNGFPNFMGLLELDASIMNGKDLTAGSVGALQDFVHAISVARKVMEQLPHVLLVGEGAKRFAREMGFEPHAPMYDEHVRGVYERFLQRELPSEMRQQLDVDPMLPLANWVIKAMDPEKTYGTVNVIARDCDGNLCSGVSTSGWSFKYPGRLGDSPIIGAGNYADNRYGAVACTGCGEMAIRASTSRSTVLYLKMGKTLQEAGAMAMQDLADLGGRFIDVMSFLAVDSQGNHAAFSSDPQKTYIHMRGDESTFTETIRTYHPLRYRWGK